MPMEYRRLENIPAPLSRIVQGTVMLNDAEQEAADELLDAVWAQGGRTFDTAHGYGSGACERALGAWLASRGVREETVILGKGAHPYDGRTRVTPEDITSDLHDSLGRMGVDVIDIYVLHRDNTEVPVGPIVEVLNQHQQEGRIRTFGGSNWTTARIAEANVYAAEHGLNPFTVSSPNFSLAPQTTPPWEGCISISGEQGASERAWYAEHGMPVFPWSSLAGGFFSGRFRRDNLDTFETYLDKLAVTSYGTEDNFTRLDHAEALAERHGATVTQIAMAFVIDQPMEVFPLVGCRNGTEFAANTAALELKLSPAELAWANLETDERPW